MRGRLDEVTGVEMPVQLPRRGDFLRLVGAAGLGAAVGSKVLLREALALGPTGPTNPSFSFSIKADYSAFDVISDNFVAVRDDFDRNQGVYTVCSPSTRSSSTSTSWATVRMATSS